MKEDPLQCVSLCATDLLSNQRLLLGRWTERGPPQPAFVYTHLLIVHVHVSELSFMDAALAHVCCV